MFDTKTLKHLCYIDGLIDDHIFESNYTDPSIKLFKHSLNLPLYTTCPNMTTLNSCESLNEHDINEFRNLIDKCQIDPSLVACQAYSINQVINWILPIDRNETIISIVLKVSMYKGEHLEFYQRLIGKINVFLREIEGVELVGVNFNMKNEEFGKIICQDTFIGLLSAILVVSCFLLYSRSLIFTLVIISTVSLSAGIAFFIYTTVFNIEFFPFINLLVIVILVSIGADDAFLLLAYYRREIEKTSKIEYRIGDIYMPIYYEHDLLSQSLRISLHHSLVSMFITSFTTAITFLTNLSSHVIVLKCFGIYAFLTIITNYILVSLILPSTIILLKRPRAPTNIKPQVLAFTKFTDKFKYPIFAISVLLSTACAIFIFKNLEVPKTNPTKVLISSNIHEFFDDNIHKFNFQWKRSARIMKNFWFGVSHDSEFVLFPSFQKRRWKIRNNFNITVDDLMYYKNIAILESSRYHFLNFTYIPWSDKVLRLNETCLDDHFITSECILQTSVKYSNYLNQFPNDFSVTPGDGPYINEDFKISGYFISIPTNEKLRVDADAISRIFEEIEGTCDFLRLNHTNVLCTSSPEVTRFYDIIYQLKTSTYTSVGFSIIICLFVIIICTRQFYLSIICSFVILSIILWTVAVLILLGWNLSVVESTILIIIIGLSFDYTLHYAVAIQDSKLNSDIQTKIISAHTTAGIACVFGAVTLCLAGFPLFFSGTASFFQIGQMLVVLGGISLIGSSIVFPAVYMCSYKSKNVTKL
ncbi:unnamed protein product [Caenorhabditis angaria]|uniref:SSD domain-containing protein n=1 Tax=Caenorhabditis angaria TaxID=860376 RepID=A0A9P1IW18_9PELO|nr:unnamed protein product [Caenorhabditis angaria]